MQTKIPWASDSLNVIKTVIDDELHGYHCTKISEGCARCYAERLNLNDGYYPWANGLPYDDAKYEYAIDGRALYQVGRWRKPRRVFVQSMSDLFHEDIPDDLIREVLETLNIFKRHTFIFLTKRPERMKEMMAKAFPLRPPRHFWLLVTAENQARANERVPVLLSIPATVHGVSIEPCLGPVRLTEYLPEECCNCSGDPTIKWRDPDGTPRSETCHRCNGTGFEPTALDWVILGCETGPGRRPMQPEWTRDVKDQCVAAGTAFFLKQMYGDKGGLLRLPELDGRVWNEYPEVNC